MATSFQDKQTNFHSYYIGPLSYFLPEVRTYKIGCRVVRYRSCDEITCGRPLVDFGAYFPYGCYADITPTIMEKKMHKSGSLKRKEQQEAERQESSKRCRPITDFIISQPPSTSMSSSATSNQEARNKYSW